MTVNEANGKSSKSTQLTHSAMRFYILDAYLTARERCYTNNNLNKDVQLIAFFFLWTLQTLYRQISNENSIKYGGFSLFVHKISLTDVVFMSF